MVDITHRAQAEMALRISERKHRALFEASRDAIMTLDPESNRWTSGNSAAVKIFGVTTEAELINRRPADFSPELQPDGRISAEKAREIDHDVMANGSRFFEWKHRRLNGEEFFADVLLTRIEWEGKHP